MMHSIYKCLFAVVLLLLKTRQNDGFQIHFPDVRKFPFKSFNVLRYCYFIIDVNITYRNNCVVNIHTTNLFIEKKEICNLVA